ncbi:7258_t:CDS:2 [Cetraspora pellucida]|uniref:7258_t:CDS:1 n=1 Tax=Cetraspora pellucida TaxID=1433469 RepID=A0A9N9AFN4_9GLOM|nr:7258_t:CDS:2 [Cetraspora pellucida]
MNPDEKETEQTSKNDLPQSNPQQLESSEKEQINSGFNDVVNSEEQKSSNEELVINRPVTVDDVLSGKITLPKPTPKNVNDFTGNKKKSEKPHLSTTDSQQEFLVLPDTGKNFTFFGIDLFKHDILLTIFS